MSSKSNISTGTATGPHTVKMEGWLQPAPFEQLLQIEIVEASSGRATLRMPFLIEFAQALGFMHGGVLVSLADTCLVMAIKSLLPPETPFVTVSMQANFLHPVKQGLVTAKARIQDRKDRLLRGRACLYDDAGQKVMECHCSFKISRGARIEPVSFTDKEISD